MKLSGTDKPSAFFLYHLMWEASIGSTRRIAVAAASLVTVGARPVKAALKICLPKFAPSVETLNQAAPSATAAPMSRPLFGSCARL